MKEPETDNLETLIPGLKVSKETIDKWRTVRDLFFLFIGASIFYGACGTLRYLSCDVNNEQKTITQCLFPELVKNEIKSAKKK